MKNYGIRERAAMIALITLGQEMANSELEKKYKLGLSRIQRENLIKDGLLSSRKKGNKGYFHTLTDKGWKWVANELSAGIPQRAQAAESALYLLMNGLAQSIASRGLTLREFISTMPGTQAVDTEIDGDLPKTILKKCAKLSKRPNDWVELKQLRPQLGGASKKKVDETIRKLYRDKKVNLTVQDDQGSLTEDDRKSALTIGANSMHFISLR